jgi:hypothetical protein
MTQLSPHFSYDEAIRSATATAHGIDNTPPADVLANMTAAAEMLETVRSYLAQPMNIDSWFRCDALNIAVGGAGHSAHESGWAIDFVCPAFGDPEAIVKFLISTGIKFDQLIVENNSWVHISFAPAMRQMVLTAHFAAGQPASYTQGV